MRTVSRIWFLVLAVVLAAGGGVFNWLVSFDPERRNVYVFTEMAYSKAYETNGINPVMRDRRTQQLPPYGTIARGLVPVHYTPSPEDAVRAGEELVNPFARADAAALARGKDRYETFCVPCHGAGGLGDGTITRRGFPPPPSLLADRAKNLKDGQMFHILTYGQRAMPSYAVQVERDDRWKIVQYVRSLQQGGAQ